jgi:aryl-alcohol dehydrogenase-like predicted oxidoreductase
VLDDREVLNELAGLRATGVFIGLTTSGPEQGAAIERALEVGGFDSVESTWNLLERSAGAALAAAHAAGMGVMIKEALANGRLTDRGDVPVLLEAAREAGVTPDALALAAVLAQPWVDVVLSGATTVPELESNLGALAVDVDIARFDGVVEDPDTYWKQRAQLPWN